MDYLQVEEQIKLLVSKHELKDEDAIIKIPMDRVHKKYGICPDDLICYYCHRIYDGCRHNCGIEARYHHGQ